MTADGSISDSAQPARASRKRVALRWGLWGVLSMPPTVLLHELGHFLVFWGLGFPAPPCTTARRAIRAAAISPAR